METERSRDIADETSGGIDQVDCEWLILADGAQVANNKLYLMGGGWDVLTVNGGFPAHKHLGIASSFRIPWNETNRKHNIEITIADDDATELAKLEAQVEVGRPPGVPLGHSQRVQLALETVMVLPKACTYVITAYINGKEAQRTTFFVRALAAR